MGRAGGASATTMVNPNVKRGLRVMKTVSVDTQTVTDVPRRWGRGWWGRREGNPRASPSILRGT